MKLLSIFGLLSFGTICVAEVALKNRATASIGRLYAYGDGISGLPVFYGDSSAFIGSLIPAGISVAKNVTFAHPSTSNNSVVATPVNTTSEWNSPSLYINDATDSFQPAGFITSANSTNSSTETSFILFGHLLHYKSSQGVIQAQFYATPTSTNGVYHLMWNADNTVQDGAVPVAVKNIAPPAITQG